MNRLCILLTALILQQSSVHAQSTPAKNADNESRQETRVALRARALGVISVFQGAWPPGPAGQNPASHYWLIEDIGASSPGRGKLWLADCNSSTSEVSLSGGKFSEEVLRSMVELRVHLGRSPSIQRFFSPFAPNTIVEVEGIRPDANNKKTQPLKCPSSDSLKAWQDEQKTDHFEYTDATELRDVPILLKAALSKPKK